MSAIAALKGYRTQFLYSVHYILSNLANGYTFRLEGNEDMDVLDKEGKLLYAIQLKNLSRTITISDLLSESRTSFLKRFVEQYPTATPILVAYNEIGAELLNWKLETGQLTQKDKAVISKYKLTADNWKLIKSKTVFQRVEESQIYSQCLHLLKKAFPIMDPAPTIDYLLTRVMAAAEARMSFTAADFSVWIQHFAEYLSERIAVHEQIGIYLRPLQSSGLRDTDNSAMEQEFFKASVTRFEHILLGLNVERESPLLQVNEHFAQTNTVIITGASGQGKTTLAYDYAYRYASHSMLYELAIQQDPLQTQKSIQAVAAIGKRLETPVLFIINVIPNTTDWIKLVKECSHIKNIRFLITVRQEDWRRARSVGIEFTHKEVELALTKSEAQIIYDKLNSIVDTNRHLDFEEAWMLLGTNPPMLEFAYSVTQGDSLKNKLYQQVQQLTIEDNRNASRQIELLKLVSLADALGARIDVAKLKDAARFQFDIQNLEKEYLLRLTEGGKFLQGLHLVRSTILIDLLFDELTTLKKDYVLRCLKLVAEEDLYIFLLQALHLGLVTPHDLKNFVRNDQDIDWSLYGALLQAFLWAGIREYVENNRAGLDEFRKIYADGWLVTANVFFKLRVDFTAFISNPLHRAIAQAKIDELNEKIQDKQAILNLAGLVLNEIPLPRIEPQTPFQWQSLTWKNHL